MSKRDSDDGGLAEMSRSQASPPPSARSLPAKAAGLLTSLRAKLLAAFLVVALIPLVIVFLINLRDTERALSQAAYQSLFAAASRTAVGLDAFIQGNLEVIGTEARSPDLATFLLSQGTPAADDQAKAHLKHILSIFAKRHPVFISSYALVDITGHNVVDTDPAGVGRDLSRRSYFTYALLTGLPYSSPVEFSAENAKPYLYFSSPVYSPAGKPLGVLRARYSAAVLQQLIVKDSALVGPQSFAMLLDENHLVLASGLISPGGSSPLLYKIVSPASAQRLAQMQKARRLPPGPPEAASFDCPDLDKGLATLGQQAPFFTVRLAVNGGRVDAGAVTKMATHPWRVVFLEPRDSFLTAIKTQTRRSLLFAVLVTCVVAIIAIGVARLLTKPIIELTAMARMMGAGNLNVATRIKSSDEIGTLADTLNRMAHRVRDSMDSLRDTNQELEQEIAERNRIEEDLARMVDILEATSDLVSLGTPDTKLIYMNQAGRRLLGWPLNEDLGQKTISDAHPQWALDKVMSEGLPEAIAGGVWTGETTLLAKDGREIPASQVIMSHKSPDGQVEYISTIIRDVTETRKAAEDLRASEERYRSLFNSISDFIYTHDLSGRFLDLNPRAAASLGYTQDEVVGRLLQDFMPERYRASFTQEFIPEIQQHGQLEGVLILIDKQGSDHYIEYRSSLVRQRGRETLISGSGRDITERVLAERELRNLEEQLAHSQKMQSIGTLAGGIAHDFNNILGAIMGFSELGLDGAQNGKTTENEHLQVLKAAERAASLVRQILTFSRKAEFELKPVNLNQEIHTVAPILKRTIPKMVEVELHLAEDLRRIGGDANQIEQILLNLAANAADAMPQGGRLVIETENLVLDEDYSRTHLEVTPGPYVLLRVSDTGHGMDDETIKRIFDPFFTTKETGKGTGLGLSSVFGIVKGHQGHLTCYSEVDQGTTFDMIFPVLAEDVAPADPDTTQSREVGSGQETILLVDDERALRTIGQELLTSSGYQTLTASSGEQALEIYRERGSSIDLVVLDIGMPGMGGHRCMEELLAYDPTAKVIIASGYSPNAQLKDTIDSGAAGYIAKPFRKSDFLSKVREVLDG